MTISKALKFSVLAIIAGMALIASACSNQPVTDEEQAAAELAAQPVSSLSSNFAEIMQAAAQGDVEAQCRLGLWYQEDHSESPRDRVRAYAWYKLAANQGDFGAKYAMERFEAELTNDERVTADDWVDRWQPGDTLEK